MAKRNAPTSENTRFANARKISGIAIRAFEDAGEVLECEVVKFRPGKFGDLCEAIDLSTGEIVRFPVHTALVGLLEEGKAYRLEYRGEEKSAKSGRTFKAFDVYEAE